MKATRCSVDGCDRGAPIVCSMCKMHYQRMQKRGTTDLLPRRGPSATERLVANLVRMPNGCLEWTGYTNPMGYGQIGVDGKLMLTHRLAWELANGPIPDGLCVCHACDRPPCADVTHLFLGTRADNDADRDAKGRTFNGNTAKTHCPADHPYDDINTYVTPTGSRQCRICKQSADIRRKARMRGVSRVEAA